MRDLGQVPLDTLGLTVAKAIRRVCVSPPLFCAGLVATCCAGLVAKSAVATESKRTNQSSYRRFSNLSATGPWLAQGLKKKALLDF